MMTNAYTIDRPMPPLWLKYPHIHQYSIGWRMGYGEGYKFEFNDWFETLKQEEKQRYQSMFPSPKTWRGYYNDSEENDLDGYWQNGVEFWNKNGEMQYSKDQLIRRQNIGEKLDFMYFWKPGNEPSDCFSQWQFSKFEGANTYSCAEQYMMAQKGEVFDDAETVSLIMNSADPKQMKSLGRKVKNFDGDVWDKVKYSVVLNGNYYKFSQNEDMRDILLATGDAVLVEASPLDTVWGIGFSRKNSAATDPGLWRGQNLLGFALMEVRDELRRVYQSYDKIDWSIFVD